MLHIPRLLLLPLLAIALLAGCLNDSSTAPAVSTSTKSVPSFPSDPGEFVSTIDNPYLNFRIGRVFHYRAETEAGIETNVVTVTRQAKTILGVPVTVVHDEVFLDGVLTEDTFDWFAQDQDGNVWYFGEATVDVPTGDTAGSWEAGVGGAMPGIIMLAEPEVGMKYQQEDAPTVAEDLARVSGLDETVAVQLGTYTGCLKTTESNGLEPGSKEFKFYAPDVGLLLIVEDGGKGARVELTGIEH
ncbi:MAG TPA: hypothetical protein VFE28_13210 [Candidatus Krumholzibacteria bacterium]|nr:hypothetical protein [Candidatus Krumholzibacteria bacterium]